MTRLIAILLFAVTSVSFAAKFPLKASSDGRYLVDQNDQPFFSQGMAAWHLLVNEPTNVAITILDRLKTNSFNSLQTRLIDDAFQSYDSSGIDNPNAPPLDYYGDSPFLSGYSFDQINTNYFKRKRDVINWAAERGFNLYCAPLYLGYAGVNQGFYDEVITNTLAAITNYGKFIGNYFKDCSNIVWMMNGDHSPPGQATNSMSALAAGILSEDTSKLITEHVSGRSRNYSGYEQSWLTLEALYASRGPLYGLAAWQETPTLPIYHTEAPYEGDGSAPTATQMRKYMWNGVTYGALGGSFMGNRWFCEGRTNAADNTTWSDYYFTTAAQQIPYVQRYFTNRNWYLLQPHTNDSIISDADAGDINTENYNSVSRASNGSFIVIYFGVTTAPTITVRMTNITSVSNSATARWYDPRNGSNHVIGVYTNTGTQEFTPPSAEDWVLTIDADSGYLGPDEPDPPAATNYYRAYMQGKIEMSGKAVLQ